MCDTRIVGAKEDHIFSRLTKVSWGNRLVSMPTTSSANVTLVRSTRVCDPYPPPCKLDIDLYTRRILFYVAHSSIEAPWEEVMLEDFEPPELSKEDAITESKLLDCLDGRDSRCCCESFILQGVPMASTDLASPSLSRAPSLSPDETLPPEWSLWVASATLGSSRTDNTDSVSTRGPTEGRRPHLGR
jgi:hypothetical protein